MQTYKYENPYNLEDTRTTYIADYRSGKEKRREKRKRERKNKK